MKTLVALVVLYLLPSILKSGKSNNKILNAVIFILRLPGISMRVVLLALSFFAVLLFSILGKWFVKKREYLMLPSAYISPFIAHLLFGITYKIEGIEKLKDFSHGILIMNHQSFFDGPFLCLLARHTEKPFVGVAKKSLESWPIFGWFWHTIGGIFVNNSTKNKEETEKSIEQMKIVCQRIKEEKVSVLIFPEGHRNSEKKILEFKKGAFHMAYDAQVPILPVVVQSYFDKLFECNFPWNPKVVILRILDIIPTDNISNREEITKITNDTKDTFDKVLAELNKIDC